MARKHLRPYHEKQQRRSPLQTPEKDQAEARLKGLVLDGVTSVHFCKS